MRTITSSDIASMLEAYIAEGLKATAGKKKKIIISPGFKIMHTESGLTYTVEDVVADKKGSAKIRAISGDGKSIDILQKDFKKYQGL